MSSRSNCYRGGLLFDRAGRCSALEFCALAVVRLDGALLVFKATSGLSVVGRLADGVCPIWSVSSTSPAMVPWPVPRRLLAVAKTWSGATERVGQTTGVGSPAPNEQWSRPEWSPVDDECRGAHDNGRRDAHRCSGYRPQWPGKVLGTSGDSRGDVCARPRHRPPGRRRRSPAPPQQTQACEDSSGDRGQFHRFHVTSVGATSRAYDSRPRFSGGTPTTVPSTRPVSGGSRRITSRPTSIP